MDLCCGLVSQGMNKRALYINNKNNNLTRTKLTYNRLELPLCILGNTLRTILSPEIPYTTTCFLKRELWGRGQGCLMF